MLGADRVDGAENEVYESRASGWRGVPFEERSYQPGGGKEGEGEEEEEGGGKRVGCEHHGQSMRYRGAREGKGP